MRARTDYARVQRAQPRFGRVSATAHIVEDAFGFDEQGFGERESVFELRDAFDDLDIGEFQSSFDSCYVIAHISAPVWE